MTGNLKGKKVQEIWKKKKWIKNQTKQNWKRSAFNWLEAPRNTLKEKGLNDRQRYKARHMMMIITKGLESMIAESLQVLQTVGWGWIANNRKSKNRKNGRQFKRYWVFRKCVSLHRYRIPAANSSLCTSRMIGDDPVSTWRFPANLGGINGSLRPAGMQRLGGGRGVSSTQLFMQPLDNWSYLSVILMGRHAGNAVEICCGGDVKPSLPLTALRKQERSTSTAFYPRGRRISYRNL